MISLFYLEDNMPKRKTKEISQTDRESTKKATTPEQDLNTLTNTANQCIGTGSTWRRSCRVLS